MKIIEKTSAYHTVNGDLHCVHVDNVR